MSEPGTITPGPVRPIDLPEVQQCVAQYLDIKDLRHCILVSRQWNQSFLPFIWQEVRGGTRLSTGENQENIRTPVHSQDVLQRHSHLIRALYVPAKSPGNYAISYPRLRSLYLDPYSAELDVSLDEDEEEEEESEEEQQAVVESFIAIITLNPSIIKLDLDGLYPPISVDFWTAVSERLPRLKGLAVYRSVLQDEACSHAIWRTCLRLETLTIQESTIPTSTSTGLLMEGMIFASIRTLRLTNVFGLGAMGELDIIARCPQLKCLEWTTLYSADEEDLIERVSNRFGALGEKATWPQLGNLGVDFTLQDKDLASILNRTAVSLDTLQFVGTSHPPYSCTFNALRRHFHTLDRLIVEGTNALSSHMHQVILSSCPSLRTFTGCDFAARDALAPDSGPWICLSIKVLRVHFVFEEDEDHLHPLIFERLSKLVRLEDLGGGIKGRRKRGLDFRLASGLSVLSTLIRLRGIHLGDSQAIGEKEVDWMIEHWPKLSYTVGRLNSDVKTNHKLLSRLDIRNRYP